MKYIADEASDIMRRLREIQREEGRKVEEALPPLVSDFDGKPRMAPAPTPDYGYMG